MVHECKKDHERFLYVAVKFPDWRNFPNVIGCINGGHIRIKYPTEAGSLFYNYKQFSSTVLQGVADSENRCIAYAKQSDGGTFCGSTL